MMIDDDTLKQLLRINDELLQPLQVAERKARHGNLFPADTTRDDLTHILIEPGKTTLLMQR
jgi:hypothetical protein